MIMVVVRYTLLLSLLLLAGANPPTEQVEKEISTKGDFEATYFHLKTNLLKFRVKTTKDANVILTKTTNPNLDVDPYFEIILGGLNNVHSGIRRKRPHLFVGTNREKVLVDTPGILSGEEFRGFWVKIDGKTILVGKENEKYPFMVWTDPEPVDFPYYGVSSCCGATAEWKIDDGINDNSGAGDEDYDSKEDLFDKKRLSLIN